MIKQKILKILKEGEKSTTEIASKINRNYYDTVNFLKELKKEEEIRMIKINKYTRWELIK